MTWTDVGPCYRQRQFHSMRQSWNYGRTRAHDQSDLLHALGPRGSRADRTSNFRIACRMSPSVGPDDARPGALPAAILLGFRPLRRVGIEGSEIVCRDRDNLRLCTCITLAFWTYFFGSIAAGITAFASFPVFLPYFFLPCPSA
jgi:hypothetical protein